MTSTPHGGRLVTISTFKPTPEEIKDKSESLKVQISDETKVTISNIANGILSPLTGFLNAADYHNVIDNMRLSDDTPWTIPILLHVPESFTAGSGDEITLVDEKGLPAAQLDYEEIYVISKKECAEKVFKTVDEAHPGVAKIYSASEKILAGRLKSVAGFENKAFENVTLFPKETRVLFDEKGWRDIIAFQTATRHTSDTNMFKRRVLHSLTASSSTQFSARKRAAISRTK